MTTAHSRVTAQGQISVPAEVRRKLGLTPGSVLEWDERDGEWVVRRAKRTSSLDAHRALFPKPPKPRSLEELKAGVAKYIRAKHARR